MKKTDYINAIDKVKIQNDEKSKIWQTISDTSSTKIQSSRRISVKRIAAVATAAACIAIIATPMLSSGVESYLSKYHSDAQNIIEKVETGIFEDSDGHVRITVEEMLSDVQSVYMIVSYEALDETGREWLANKDFKQTIYDPQTDTTFRAGMSIQPIDAQSCSYGNNEIKEKQTPTQRWFYVAYEGSLGVETSSVDLFGYYMTDGTRTTHIDTTGNVETYTYELSSEESPSERFIPKYLTVSDISFSIFGENISIYEEYAENDVYGIRRLISIEEADEIMESTYFIMEDGEKILAACVTMGGDITPDASNNYSDTLILSGHHHNFNKEEHNYEYRAVDSKKIIGLEIKGVYYKLK